MTTATPSSIEKPAAKPTPVTEPARLFYFGAAIILLALVLWGFQQFYFHGKAYPDRPLTPPIRALLIQHGIAMAAWMLLFIVQPLLIVLRKHRAHMMLGKFGAVLAIAIVYLGMRVGVESARVNPPDLLLWNLPPKQFLAVPLVSITIFGILVAIAIWKRKRPAIHRAMMLLAGLAVMAAALDRIDPIRNLYADTFLGTLFGPFGSSLAIGALFVLLNWALTRRIDRYLAAGVIALTIASAAIMQLATSQLWDAFARWVLG